MTVNVLMNTAGPLYWIKERESIRLKRASGLPPPWTKDKIFIDWSFTNPRREHDRTTLSVALNWREPNRDDPDLPFAMVVASFVNNIETLEEIGYPVPWKPDHFLAVMKARAERGDRLYGPAYMIRADKRFDTTAEYQVVKVFNPLWKAREWILTGDGETWEPHASMRPRAGETLAHYYSRLSHHHGFGGGFMPGQVIAYLKYAPPLLNAKDWMTFAISGPGSRRGLNRVFGHPPDRKWPSEASWRAAFDKFRAAIQPDLEQLGLGDLHASDLQSVLCEWDKIERVRLGEGQPRRRFKPSPDPLPGSGLVEAAE